MMRVAIFGLLLFEFSIQRQSTEMQKQQQQHYHPHSSFRVQLNHTSNDSVFLPVGGGYVRAAIVYFPVEKHAKFSPQLRWLAQSWKEMQRHEPLDSHTDLVVVTQRASLSVFGDLNCTTVARTSRDDAAHCRLVTDYRPLRGRDESFKDYNYADSIDSIVYAHEQGALGSYDALLRTDLDTFLTPAFSAWRPSKLAVGIGKYCFDGQITCHRLRRIAIDMGLSSETTTPIENIGSTWYGPATTVIECASTSIRVMKYLSQFEFTKADKGPKINGAVLNWPGWHYGVLTMYAGQIAVNHCARDVGLEKRSDMLDVATDSTGSIYDHAHLHTWQNNRNFSKGVFAKKGYDKVDPARLNTDIIREYALFHALQSRPVSTTA